ncbi:hybrid-cluster NAD(P)-dependent oxidoreductase [Pseudaeromonas paramecii]|uniref:Hybrid-cluster NAD(P)-dependent oxidoreductase n=2 Tax=Pseudaeromonas paramecii TaxID=2138166 RepID=A0ABP8QD02_9GAMM
MNPLEHPHWHAGSRQLTCVAKQAETWQGDTLTAATLVLQDLASPCRFAFLPGQYLLIGTELAGKPVQRAYSISSSPAQTDRLAITVKRVAGGRLSNYLLDALQPGMTLSAQPPQGHFHLPATLPDQVVLLSGGSGISPMLSMTRALLASDYAGTVHFIHSAKRREEVIALAWLLDTAARHRQLRLSLQLSEPASELPGLPGRLSAETLAALLPDLQGVEFFLCGSDRYLAGVRALLAHPRYAGLPVHQEAFDLGAQPQDPTPQAQGHRITVPAFDKVVALQGDEPLLAALEREGLPIIGACRTGVCGSCKCRVLAGEVHSQSSLPLSPEEQAQGYVLACASRAASDLTLALN